MSHTAERCRCRPSGPGGTFCVQAGSDCLGARVTRTGALGMGGAQVLAGRHGNEHLAQRMPGVVLAAAPCRTSRAPRALTALTAGLARGPSTTGASGRLALLLGQSGPGLEPAPGVAPNVRRPRAERDLQTGRSVQGTNGEWGSKHGTTQQQNEQIGRKTHNFVRNSYEFGTNFTLPQYSHTFVPAAHWWLSGNVKLGLIWGSVVHCDVFVLVCCAFAC